MILKKLKSHMGISNHSWLYSVHHFSFAEYYDINNMGIGPLRVINDDIIAPHKGFDTHPHRDMEILTYIIEGAITHKDSIHNKKRKVGKGAVQYMSAGTGVAHSEVNEEDTPTRLAQIWVIPDKNGYTPAYGQIDFKWEDRINKLLHIASGNENEAPIKINQDINIYTLVLEKNKTLDFTPKPNFGYYIAFFDGIGVANSIEAEKYEAIIGDEPLKLISKADWHMIIFEIKKT